MDFIAKPREDLAAVAGLYRSENVCIAVTNSGSQNGPDQRANASGPSRATPDKGNPSRHSYSQCLHDGLHFLARLVNWLRNVFLDNPHRNGLAAITI